MQVVAAILVGGKSLRMGRSKALLEIDGTTLVEKIYGVLSELKPYVSEIIFSGVLQGKTTLLDEKPFSGPIEGIRTVAKSYLGKMDALLTVPVDMPYLDSKSLLPLFLHYEKEKPAALYFENNPLPALFGLDQKLIEMSQNNRSVRGLLMDLGAIPLTVHDPQFLTNTNTPEEWAKIKGIEK